MITSYSRTVPVLTVTREWTENLFGRLLVRALERVRYAICGLNGHDTLLQFERDRMFLRCTSCGYDTPGWVIGQHPPRVRFRGVAQPRPLHSSVSQLRRLA